MIRMNQRVTYQKLDEFVRDLCSRVNDPTGNFTYVKLLRLTLAQFTELNLFVIPSVRTIQGTVDSSLMLEMPDDNSYPISAFIYRTYQNSPVLFRLGKIDRTHYISYEFASCPDEVDTEIQTPIDLYNYNEFGIYNARLYSEFYGEQYGRRTTRFYGYFSFDKENNRIEFVGLPEGEIVMVVYNSTSDDCRMIPSTVKPMLSYRVLQQFYETSSPGIARSMERQFKIHLAEFKRLADNYSYDDYLDSITSEYASYPR